MNLLEERTSCTICETLYFAQLEYKISFSLKLFIMAILHTLREFAATFAASLPFKNFFFNFHPPAMLETRIVFSTKQSNNAKFADTVIIIQTCVVLRAASNIHRYKREGKVTAALSV